MTQAELAAKVTSRKQLSGIEHDRVAFGVERAKRLARALKVHPAVLLFPGLGSGFDGV
jgi:transcriptional regulator with XRE-family HTH domain